jgi:hypothetical protein
MNNLEQFIDKNRLMFDEEPDSGHFERLQKKMHRSRRITMIRWSIGIAAVLAVVFTARILRQPDVLPCEMSADMKMCYLEQFDRVAGQIEALAATLDAWDRKQVMDNVQFIIHTVANEAEADIPAELPPDARKAILSEYYQRYLVSMQNMVVTLNL